MTFERNDGIWISDVHNDRIPQLCARYWDPLLFHSLSTMWWEWNSNPSAPRLSNRVFYDTHRCVTLIRNRRVAVFFQHMPELELTLTKFSASNHWCASISPLLWLYWGPRPFKMKSNYRINILNTLKCMMTHLPPHLHQKRKNVLQVVWLRRGYG